MNGVDFVVDTNILIYIHEGKKEVEPFISYSLAVSFVTEIELLGFSKLYPLLVFSEASPTTNVSPRALVYLKQLVIMC
jgi:hypothetical protein